MLMKVFRQFRFGGKWNEYFLENALFGLVSFNHKRNTYNVTGCFDVVLLIRVQALRVRATIGNN